MTDDNGIEWLEEMARLQAKAADDLRATRPQTWIDRRNRGRLIRMYQNKVVEFWTEAQRQRQAVQP